MIAGRIGRAACVPDEDQSTHTWAATARLVVGSVRGAATDQCRYCRTPTGFGVSPPVRSSVTTKMYPHSWRRGTTHSADQTIGWAVHDVTPSARPDRGDDRCWFSLCRIVDIAHSPQPVTHSAVDPLRRGGAWGIGDEDSHRPHGAPAHWPERPRPFTCCVGPRRPPDPRPPREEYRSCEHNQSSHPVLGCCCHRHIRWRCGSRSIGVSRGPYRSHTRC